MEIIDVQIRNYAADFTSPADALLQELEAWTRKMHPAAHMISGQVQGQLLSLLSQMIHPKRILEIGTFVGYSALCLAKGLGEDGLLFTIEKREADHEIARTFFDRSEYADRIRALQGDATEVLSEIHESWDLVFIDADKVNYTRYYELVLSRVRKGGWIIADNVFFHGEILENPVKGKNAKAISAFNEHVRADARVEQLMLTVRDGLMIIRKK